MEKPELLLYSQQTRLKKIQKFTEFSYFQPGCNGLKAILYLLFFTAYTGLIIRCSQPNEAQNPYLPNSNPDNVVKNLVTSYQAKNLAEYLNCFSEDFSFVLTDGNSWGKREEGMIHTKLFSQALTLELKLSPLRSSASASNDTEPLEAIYQYDLTLRESGSIVNQAAGQLLFNIIRTESKGWLIKDWYEMNVEFAKKQAITTDSIDYFPLHVGNYWIYEERNEGIQPDIKAMISDSVVINNKTYYVGGLVMISGEWKYYKVRKDSLGRIFGFNEADSSDVLVYDFAANAGDTFVFPTNNYNSQVILQLQGKNGTLETPAGTFNDVLGFESHFENQGAIFFEAIAPGIGTIAFGLHNEYWHLKEARIDTLIIPGISVGVKENSWEEIKRYWLNEK